MDFFNILLYCATNQCSARIAPVSTNASNAVVKAVSVAHFDVVIIGAGAAGLMCAFTAGQRGRRVLLLDHANKPGKKILMSGGGRCNFTNLWTTPDNFISDNPHFCKSALSRYSQNDFLAMVERHGIAWHEKKLGQLFCDDKSRDILNMLLRECDAGSVQLHTSVSVSAVQAQDTGFNLATTMGPVSCAALVVATGGLSIPKMGASGFGYELARQFGLRVLPTSPALVPFTLSAEQLDQLDGLSGVSTAATVRCNGVSFAENILFTHRGLSGPAMLQISSYWQPGDAIDINLLPELNLEVELAAARRQQAKTTVGNWLSQRLSRNLARRLLQWWCPHLLERRLADCSDKDIGLLTRHFCCWRLKPGGTEGYRTAEVTLGGIDTDEISSRSFAAHRQPNLYFIGEVLDVTGHLGGFNFQWAWASGHACGQFV